MAISNYLKLGDAVVLPGNHPNLLSFLDISLPNPAGLVGLYLLGGSASASLRNFADSTKPLVAAGAPVMGAFGATLSAANYFDTGITTGADRTWTVIAKPSLAAASADRSVLVSNRRYTGGNYRGDAFTWEEPNLLLNRFDRTLATSGQAAALSVAGAADAWNGFAAITDSTGVAKTGWRKNGTTTWTAPSASVSRTVYTGDTLRIGSSPSVETGTSNVGLVALQNVILTQAQVDENMAYLSELLADNYGITAF
jgi:hypothetical protein